MIAYDKFLELCQSTDSESRGQAAYLAALAFVDHKGPADEQAALYASLIGFLDDNSVKVRAALAYGLLHAKCAPRPIILSLLHDEPIIARAIAQYSPVLVDADLIAIIKTANKNMLEVIVARDMLSSRLAHSLLEQKIVKITLSILGHQNVSLCADRLHEIAIEQGDDAMIRGALFSRKELQGETRLMLIKKVSAVLSEARIVKGAITAHRLKRLMRNAQFNALLKIGEAAASDDCDIYAKGMIEKNEINTRLMLHAVVNGHVMFFAQCLSLLAKVPQEKVFSMLNNGSRAALKALFAKSGFAEQIKNLLCRLIFYARTSDLADDLSARHFIVTALIDELLIEHDGVIPLDLEEAFSYLNEQNIMLARNAARGVMSAFAKDLDEDRQLLNAQEQALALPLAQESLAQKFGAQDSAA